MNSNRWAIFLDDQRFPPCDDKQYWIVCRSVYEAIECVEAYGECPQLISFDHDLGEDSEDAMKFAHWIIDRDLDCMSTFIPCDFEYRVHSENPVGRDNIEGLLKSYFETRQIHH